MTSQKSTLTAIEQEIELARWKQSPRAQLDLSAGKKAEHLKMLRDRKAGKTPLYVSLVSGKAFHWDGSYR